jgi:hypothetical protein
MDERLQFVGRRLAGEPIGSNLDPNDSSYLWVPYAGDTLVLHTDLPPVSFFDGGIPSAWESRVI